MDKIEPYTNSVGFSERTDSVIGAKTIDAMVPEDGTFGKASIGCSDERYCAIVSLPNSKTPTAIGWKM